MGNNILLKLFVVFIILLYSFCYFMYGDNQGKNTQKEDFRTTPAMEDATLASKTSLTVNVNPPNNSADTAVLMDISSGVLLYEKNGDKKIYPASTTKIMTALLAIEYGDLKKIVTIPDNWLGVEGSSIYLKPGEQITMEDLLYGLMLRSGNDAAVIIANEISGSVEEFVRLMNSRAKELGAKNTNYMNSNGLHDDNHYTTAYDMAIISKHAMQNPTFKEIVSVKEWTSTRTDKALTIFYNKNKVVYDYEGGTGVKIGYTQTAGRTLVASSERNGMELLCVVMNAPDWFEDSYALMDYGYEYFEQVKVAEAQQILKKVPVEYGDKDYVSVATKTDIAFPVKPGESSDIILQYVLGHQCTAPTKRWQEAGLLNVYLKDEFLFSAPLYYMEDIEYVGKQ